MSPLSLTKTIKEPIKAIKDLHELHKNMTFSRAFSSYLSSFSTEKEHTLPEFSAGIEAFMRVANLSPQERTSFYGNKLLGLHYNNDLAKLYNESAAPADQVEAYKLNFICPSEWSCQSKDGCSTLIYKGADLASAFDKLLQGPTVIDCGMFCQLSIWFGVRHMLGNEAFNEIFGKIPFYLTQFVYNPITDASEPFTGNPLYPFLDHSSAETLTGVAISHVYNHALYQKKHPGGNYAGENCIVINGKYTIFDAMLDNKNNLFKKDVEKLLLEAFNALQNVNDHTRLALYREKNPEELHPRLSLKYGELISMAENFSHYTIDEDVFSIDTRDNPPRQVQFNFERFCLWLSHIRNNSIEDIHYEPVAVNAEATHALVDQIPYENKNHISFATFKHETQLHQQIFTLSKKFCFDVMNNQSVYVVLSGQAGIGKTASAVSCAKELASRGKNVMWISEVTVRGWTEKADSMEALLACANEIRQLLLANPDVVFLDDDNLVGYAGKVLLEEIYRWYATNPDKGLFITSNEPISFEACYKPRFGQTYNFPPFSGYTSSHFQNTHIRKGLHGKVMRPEHVLSICDVTEPQRVNALLNYNQGASVGIIVSHDAYEMEKSRLGDIEFVPGFLRNVFDPMTRHSEKYGSFGPAYDALTAEQKKYIKTWRVNKSIMRQGYTYKTNEFSHIGIYIRIFDKTPHQIIAVELLQQSHWSKKEIIDEECVRQLLSVVNYAHDEGGKKILLVNHTNFLESELLTKIEEGIPEKEKERTMARITGMLFSPDLAQVISISSSDMTIAENTSMEFEKTKSSQSIASQITLGLPKPSRDPKVEPETSPLCKSTIM